ncbi:MAG TPA: PEGA domain-containing protein [Candidatus Eisenbacteria bacterium]
MNTADSTQVLIQGLVRSPDREGALAHLDPERGFAFVGRGSMSFSDVIDPTIWVKEKLSLALSEPEDSQEPHLRRAIATLRAVHGELMARPDRERTWISALVVLFRDGEGMALAAGDCPCYRFRAATLSRLGRAAPENPTEPPEGALGSEAQVRLEMVPLLPQPGDCYILATHPLREGELSLLARDLASARDVRSLLRTACSGSSESGRVAIAALSGGSEAPEIADEPSVPEALGPLELDPIEPAPVAGSSAFGAEAAGADVLDHAAEEEETAHAPQAEGTARASTSPSAEAPGTAPSREEEPGDAVVPPEEGTEREDEPASGFAGISLPRLPSDGAFFERRPWYEWVALWGGGALAIIALALLVRAIMPGILGTPRTRVQQAALPLGTGGTLDLFSDPPGAAVKIDGVPIATRTPATDVEVAPGRHRVELDWGVYGTRRDTVEVAAGARLTLRPRLLGSVGFRSSDATRVLDVFVDGAYVGSTPVALDSLVVGRHLVRFGGPGVNSSAQEVEVLQGTHIELFGNAGAVPAKGRVTIRSALLTDTGFEAGRGDPVWVDGEMRGVTPLTVDLKPGAHSFRVLRRNFPPQISVLEVNPGGEQFLTAEFGSRSEDPLRFTPPDFISISDPLPVTIALPEGEWDPSMALWVYAAPPGASFQARRMTRLDAGSKRFAALLPPEVLRNSARQVRLYFKAVGAAGRELYSEIHTLPVKN